MDRRSSVIWSKLAREDLRRLREHISRDSPDNARKFLRKLRIAAASLGDFPDKLPVVPELGLPYRERLLGRYRIIYKVADARVIVLAVEHSARDLLGAIGGRFDRNES